MPHDLGLLLDTIALQAPSRSQGIVVAAHGMASEWQVPTTLALRLPDMRHLVQEQRLCLQTGIREIIDVERGARVEVDVPGRRHQRADRLKREPPPPLDPHRSAVDRDAEHCGDQLTLARGQRPIPAGRAARLSFQGQLCAAAAAPIASTFAGMLILSPSEKVSVSSVSASGLSVSAI